MGTLEGVMVHEQTDPSLCIAQVHEHRALDTFAPQGAPETLDLAQGLRPPRCRHHLPDATLLQLLGEGALATPGHVLAAVIGQDLLRGAVGGQRRPQHFQHQCRGLAGVQAVADDETAVIIHEGYQVNPSILPFQNEREQISLPQLIGFGPLEMAHLVGVRPRRHFLQLVAGFVEDLAHRRSAGR